MTATCSCRPTPACAAAALSRTAAVAATKDWNFIALSICLASPNRDQFHLEAKTPFGLSSPREMGRLLEKIEKGEAVSKKASEQMLQMMRGQVYSSRLPKYVTGFRVPHKTGDFLPYIGNDVGILESRGRNVVLSVFTARHFGVGAHLEDAIGRVAELVGNYFASRE
jgi:hypothetical protein